MCGISGILALNGSPVDPGILQRMNDLQRHRGPDGEGFLLGWPEADGFRHQFSQKAQCPDMFPGPRVGLGHRRLAIIDLSDRGLQPMASEDGRTWIAFNGEIYNFQELKTQLQAEGHRFTTRTDTEVLLRSYLHWGTECLSRLDGMYAFAIWDSSRRRLFCARDRLGIKPFYYATPPGYFIFASEMKSLLAFPGLQPRAHDDAVLSFLVHNNCDYGERTLLRDIHALPPAHCLTLQLDTQQISRWRYWRLEPQATNGVADSDRIDHLKQILAGTMRRHLVSDVQAGSCLSGGLDSSTVVGMIGKIAHDEPAAARAVGPELYTFTSCWNYRDLDERDYALAVARSVGAKPTLVFPTPEDFWSNFQRMAWHLDMPFGSLSYYAQWRVMRAAKEAGVKVLLDGQGGDEVFGGYAKFRYAYFASLLRSGRLARLLREVGGMLQQGDRYVLDIRTGYRYLPARLRRLLNVDSLLHEALNGDWRQVLSQESAPAARWWRNACGASATGTSTTVMQRIQLDDILLDTLQGLLRMEDRSSMAFSLEARVPFLDHKLVEYGISLPDHLKIHNGWSKYAMRQAMQGLLPEAVRMRKTKLGFASPDRYWLPHDLRDRVTELIHDGLRCRKYIDANVVRRWYSSSRSRTANTESYIGLFRILSLEMWMRAFNLS